MKKSALFIYFFLLLSISYSFKCNSVKSELLCNQMRGCEFDFDEQECQGEFNPRCSLTKCIFIDPGLSEVSKDADGSIERPFKAFNQSIKAIKSQTEIIGLNYDSKLPVLVNAGTNLEISAAQTLIIRGYFKHDYLRLDFSGSDNGIVIKNADSVQIQNIKFIAEDEFKSIFSSILVFDKVSDLEIENCHIGKTKSPTLFDGLGGNNVLITNLTIINSLPKISIFAEKKIIFDGIFIKDFEKADGQSNQIHLNCQNTLVKNSVFERIRSSKEYLFSFGFNVQLDNITFNDNSVGLLFSDFIQNFSINTLKASNSRVQTLLNINSVQQDSLNITNSNFENITIGDSIALNTRGTVSFKKVKFIDISYDPTSSSPYFEIMPRGLCIYSQSGKIRISQTLFHNIKGPTVTLINSGAKISHSIFHNKGFTKADKAQPVSWVYILADKPPGHGRVDNINIVIRNNTFSHNGNLAEFGGGIQAQSFGQEMLEIKENIFINLRGNTGGAISFKHGGLPLLSFENNIFMNNTAIRGGAVSITTIDKSIGADDGTVINVLMNNLAFNNTAQIKGGYVYNQQLKIQIHESVAAWNRAKYGAVIYVANPSSYINLNGLNRFNYAEELGSIYFGFKNSLAEINDDYPLNFAKVPNSTIFKQLPSSLQVKEYKFLQDQNIVKSILNLPPDELVKNKTIVELENQYGGQSIQDTLGPYQYISGQKIPIILQFDVFDDEENKLDYINYDTVQITVFNSLNLATTKRQKAQYKPPTIIQGSSIQFVEGTIYLQSQLIVSSSNNTELTLKLKLGQDMHGFFIDFPVELNLDLHLKTHECKIGDIYHNETNTCKRCGNNTYSLHDPYSPDAVCLTCPPNMICLGGDLLFPQDGYFRFDETYAQVTKCPISQTCISGIQGIQVNTTGQCIAPFEGNLCESCSGYYDLIRTKGSCTLCQGGVMYYAKLTAVVIGQILLVMYSISTKYMRGNSISKAYEEDDKDAQDTIENSLVCNAIIKNVISFWQTFAIINSFNFDYTASVKEVLSFVNSAVPLVVEGFSANCIFILMEISKQRVFYWTFILYSIQPVFLFLVTSLITLIMYLRKKRQNIAQQSLSNQILRLSVIIFYIFQPNMIVKTLAMFKCQNLGDAENPKYFLQADPNIECYTDDYYWCVFRVVLPISAFWIFIFPALIAFKIRNTFKTHGYSQSVTDFPFFIGGYTQNHYYWDFAVIARKLLIIVIIVFYSDYEIIGQGVVCLILLQCYIVMLDHIKPYSTTKLNDLDKLSTYCIMMLIITGTYINSSEVMDKQASGLDVILSVGSLFLMIYLVITSVIYYANVAKNQIRRMKSQAAQMWSKTINKKKNKKEEVENAQEMVDISFSDIEKTDMSKFRVDIPSSHKNENDQL